MLISEKERKIQELKECCRNLIDDFREEYEKLDELEKEQISDNIKYSAPCQIEIFWVSEPLEYQLFVLLHDFSRKDKEIIINGPFQNNELTDRLIEIMDEPRWKKKAPYIRPEGFLDPDVGDQENKYSDAFVLHFSNFLTTITNDSLANFRKGSLGSQQMGDRDWCAIFKGNIAELKPKELKMSDFIEYAKQLAASVRAGTVSQLQTSKGTKPHLKVIGTYYYPLVRIGDRLELSFKEKLYGPNVFETPKYEFEFTLKGKKGYYDKYGFVAIQSENEKEAIKVINTIFGVSLILGVESLSMRESELISSEIDPDYPVLGRSLGGYSWHSSCNRFTSTKSKEPRRIGITLNKMNRIIKTAEEVSLDEELNDLLLFLLESHTHLNSYEFSQSFMFSWFIVEKFVSRLFAEVLCEISAKGNQKGMMKKYDKWSIANKIEFLNFVGKIDEPKYEFLIGYNTKRNNFIHDRRAINESDTKKLYDFCFNIVKNEIDKMFTEKD